MLRNLFILLAALISAAAWAGELVGRVVRITDGDTISVLVERVPVKIRLIEIDAPEARQPFGTRAKQELSRLVYQKTVTIRENGRDRYGRVLGRVFVAILDINAEMVRLGYAWVFDRYVTDRSLYALQEDARRNKHGLWKDSAPMPPWEWRAQKRQ